MSGEEDAIVGWNTPFGVGGVNIWRGRTHLLRVCGALAGKKKRRSGLACLEMHFPFGKKKMDVSVKRDRFVGGATIFYHNGEVAPMARRLFSRGIGHL